jgi:hypothetical protein
MKQDYGAILILGLPLYVVIVNILSAVGFI